MKGIVAKYVLYQDKKYELVRGKSDIMIYGGQPRHYYDDWEENGTILVVRWYKDRDPKMAYELLHKIYVRCFNGAWDTDKISGNRMLTPIFE